MKINTIGAAALGLTLGFVPLAAFAEEANVSVGVTTSVSSGGGSAESGAEVEASGSADTRDGESRDARMASTTARLLQVVQAREQKLASSSEEGRGNATSSAARAAALAEFANRLEIRLESTTTAAQTIAQLRQMLQERKQELDQEASSTATTTRAILEEANQVRLAVHALLASKVLLGGIGGQVSEIAAQLNQSVATTTDAEVQIQTRGFFTKLFFGGDSRAASAIADQVSQNKDRIGQIANLLSQATTSAEVKAELQTQLEAMNKEQVRLEALAKSQNSLWGLFSWRF